MIPARARKPRDKAKVEAVVLVAQRWILAKAMAICFPSYKTVKTMLDQRMEAAPLRAETKRSGHAEDMSSSLGAVNVRGSGYYH